MSTVALIADVRRYARLEFTGRKMAVTFAAVEYDHAGAAQRAAVNGRPDWAVALRTGYTR